MRSYVLIAGLMILAGCSNPGTPPAPALPTPEPRVNPWEDMLKRDQALRRRFAGIAKGMTESEVKTIMGGPPHEVIRKTTWVYKLSPASDSLTERHWKLLVRFSDGKVQDFQDTYVCYYVGVKE
jgi:hypothetical protein